MNIERGFARAIKALNRLGLLWAGFFLFKVIQHYPSREEVRWISENGAYWRLAYKNCSPNWECLPTSIWGHVKDTSPLFVTVFEWFGIFAIGAVVINSLIHILRGFLDDEGLFADE